MASEETTPLPPGFYTGIGGYLKALREMTEASKGDSPRSQLLQAELERATLLAEQLVQARLMKLVASSLDGLSTEEPLLPAEDLNVVSTLREAAEEMRAILQGRLSGGAYEAGARSQPPRTILRFMKDTPSLVGSDIKPYGPFLKEDVVSLPLENVEKLVEHGVVKRVELG